MNIWSKLIISVSIVVFLVLAYFAFLAYINRPSSSDSLDLSNYGAVQGKVVFGPVLPVCKQDEPCYKPLKVKLIITNTDRIENSKVINSDEDGIFFAILEPGNYNIKPVLEADAYRGSLFVKKYNFIIEPGKLTTLTITIDSGIR